MSDCWNGLIWYEEPKQFHARKIVSDGDSWAWNWYISQTRSYKFFVLWTIGRTLHYLCIKLPNVYSIYFYVFLVEKCCCMFFYWIRFFLIQRARISYSMEPRWHRWRSTHVLFNGKIFFSPNTPISILHILNDWRCFLYYKATVSDCLYGLICCSIYKVPGAYFTSYSTENILLLNKDASYSTETFLHRWIRKTSYSIEDYFYSQTFPY